MSTDLTPDEVDEQFNSVDKEWNEFFKKSAMNLNDKLDYLAKQDQKIILNVKDIQLAIVEIKSFYYIRRTVEGGKFLVENDALLEFHLEYDACAWMVSFIDEINEQRRKKALKKRNRTSKHSNKKTRNYKKEKRKKRLTKKMKRKGKKR